MHKTKKDINVLLIALLLISGSIALVHRNIISAESIAPPSLSNKTQKLSLQVPPSPEKGVDPAVTQENKTIKPTEKENLGTLATLTPPEAAIYLRPHLITHSEEIIAQAFDGVPADKGLQIIQEILKLDLPRDTKLHILYEIALLYRDNKEEQHKFFDLIETDSRLDGNTPYLFVAALNQRPQQIISDILNWAQNKKDLYTTLALKHAVTQNDFERLKILHTAGAHLTPKTASPLLWHAVKNNKSADIVQFLIDNGADVTQTKKGDSLLLVAIKNLNYDLVKILIDAGIDINAIADDQVGNALQTLADFVHQKAKTFNQEEKRQIQKIDRLLREKGARE